MTKPFFQGDKILLFLLILFLPTQLGKHFWPSFAFINSLRIDYYSPTLYLWDLLLLAVIFYQLIKSRSWNKKALLLFLFFLLTQICSIVFSANTGAGLVKLGQFSIAGLFGVYIASINYSQIKKTLFLALTFGVFIQSLIAIIQFLVNGSMGFWILGERTFTTSSLSIATFNWYGQLFLRPYATFPHPNVLAAYLVLGIPLLYLIYQNLKSRFAFLFPFTLMIATTATFLTFSRGALLFLVLEVIYLLKKQTKLLFILGFFLIPFLFVRFNSAFNFDYLSFTRREQLAEIAINLFLKHPILGVGLNNFVYEVASSKLIAGTSRFLQPVHNIYLLTLAETGLVGFLGLAALIFLPLYNLWKNKQELYSKILLFCWLIILSLGFLDHYFLTLPQGLRMFFLVWGLSFVNLRRGLI